VQANPPLLTSCASIEGAVGVLVKAFVNSGEQAISKEPAAIAVEALDHAALTLAVGPLVVSTGELVATPVKDVPHNDLAPITDADRVAVRFVELARPDGA
jgi:hypothetical protein